MTLQEQIKQLENRLADAQPKLGTDGIIGDGSHECMANAYERAFDRAGAVADRAIALLKEIAGK
jgi:hypothetical protein